MSQDKFIAEQRFINYNKIFLDYKNPRISEFGINEKSKEKDILNILWREMAVNEIVLSIVSNGFWKYEPLIVMVDGENYIVIEGNRRLAAVKILHNPQGIKLPAIIKDKITDELLSDINELPVVIVNRREEAWKYIGFKHVNGPAKWGSFAKAKYIAEIHEEYGVPIDQIAFQIGDANKTAQKLYQGLMVLEQAKVSKVYDYEKDIQANRIYFSHLYTGLQRDGIQKYLEIEDANDETKEPIPERNLSKLGDFLGWLFGNKKNDVLPVIKSQNPDLKYLDEILKSRDATLALKAGETLDYSYELSRADDALFEESLSAAKRGLQKARAYLTTGYKGEEEMLRIAGSVAELADALYDEMDKVNKERTNKKKKKRLTE